MKNKEKGENHKLARKENEKKLTLLDCIVKKY